MNEETRLMLKNIVLDFWQSGLCPEEWETGLLKILAKKGDLGLPGNHRGIMLLEVSYKIVANILKMRLLPIEEELDQSGEGLQDIMRAIVLSPLFRQRRGHSADEYVQLTGEEQ